MWFILSFHTSPVKFPFLLSTSGKVASLRSKINTVLSFSVPKLRHARKIAVKREFKESGMRCQTAEQLSALEMRIL